MARGCLGGNGLAREWPRLDSGLRPDGVPGLRDSEVAARAARVLGLLWAKGEGPPASPPPSTSPGLVAVRKLDTGRFESFLYRVELVGGRRHPGKGSFSLPNSVAANARARFEQPCPGASRAACAPP